MVTIEDALLRKCRECYEAGYTVKRVALNARTKHWLAYAIAKREHYEDYTRWGYLGEWLQKLFGLPVPKIRVRPFTFYVTDYGVVQFSLEPWRADGDMWFFTQPDADRGILVSTSSYS